LRQLKCLAAGGTQITFGAMALRPLSIPNGLLIFKDIQIRGLWITRWIESAPREEIDATYTRLAAEVVSGNLHIPVDSTFRLSDFKAALSRLADPGRSGKVLLTPQ
jgi:trans-2-enoyl-CoA reductase